MKNTDENHEKRCKWWGLHIKWVLMWPNLEWLMKDSRSAINTWFHVDGDTEYTTRRNYIMNGASVLIEYSPSIFTKNTTPPGAEYFTTALTVYKN